MAALDGRTRHAKASRRERYARTACRAVGRARYRRRRWPRWTDERGTQRQAGGSATHERRAALLAGDRRSCLFHLAADRAFPLGPTSYTKHRPVPPVFNLAQIGVPAYSISPRTVHSHLDPRLTPSIGLCLPSSRAQMPRAHDDQLGSSLQRRGYRDHGCCRTRVGDPDIGRRCRALTTTNWDLASSVGATATMVAAGRALATHQEQPGADR